MDTTTYAGTGVKYEEMDPFKLMAQAAARKTSSNSRANGFETLEWTRGESVTLIYDVVGGKYLAHVEEGLGTKILVADAMRLGNLTYYDAIAQDTVAMIANDLVTLGALPISMAMHLAVGDSSWFNDLVRCQALVDGWRNACDQCGCIWSGGETPTLKDIVIPGSAVLAGSAWGMVPKDRVFNREIKHGDAIILLESSGIHANGLTLARKIADRLPQGYQTPLADVKTYGEALLAPTHLYVRAIDLLMKAEIGIRYAVNITGHGWRKLMRLDQNWTYLIEHLPTQQPLFDFIQEHGPVSDREAYGNLNMGAGFAVYVDPEDVERALYALKDQPFRSFLAGHIIESDRKSVIIEPKNIKFEASELAVR